MKKLVSVIALSLFTTLAVVGQVTITSSNVVKPGQIVRSYDQDDNNGTYPLMQGGASKTWDFSAFSKDDSTVMRAIPNGWKGHVAAKNPNTDFLLEEQSDSSTSLIDISTADLKLVGLYSEAYEDRDEPYFGITYNIVTFPMTMGTRSFRTGESGKITNEFGMDPDGPGPLPFIDSLEVTLTYNDSFEGVGYGSVKLPSVTVSNCIMVQSQSKQTYSYRAYYNNRWNAVPKSVAEAMGLDTEGDMEFSHRWWTTENNYGFPVAEYSYLEGEDSFSGPSFMDGPTTTNKTASINKTEIKVFPVPTAAGLNLNLGDMRFSTYMVYDHVGKLLYQKELNGSVIDVAQLPSGIYTLRLLGKSGMGEAKFIKQ